MAARPATASRRAAQWVDLEGPLCEQGSGPVAGVDEVGRGPLAGPVVAAAVILPPGWEDPQLDDSKRLSADQREAVAGRVRAEALAWAVGACEPEEIDRLNIHHASLEAMRRAVAGLALAAGALLVDGRFTLPGMSLTQRAVVKGDATVRSVAAASVVAKVWRDRLMVEAHGVYPAYNFAANKGYATAEHRQALAERGPCPLHRRSFARVAQMVLELG